MTSTVLAIESGGTRASVALRRADGRLSFAMADSGQSHSSRLLPLAQELLRDAGLDWQRLDGIVVGVGPGSFTGLRVACGIAQGLALGSGKPILAVNGFEATAYAWWETRSEDERKSRAANADTRLRISFDARLGERFAATLTVAESASALSIDFQESPAVVAAETAHVARSGDAQAVVDLIDPDVQAFGDSVMPLAAWIARFAVDPKCQRKGGWQGPSALRPLYVRDKVAQTIVERQELSDLAWADMTAADVASVMVIERQAYPFPWTSGNFLDSLKAGYTMRVLKERGVMIGYVVWMQVVDEVHLLNIALSPARQGRGLGAWMMRQLMAWVRELAIDQILLEVRPSNTAAIRLYRKLGFQEIGLRKGYYPNHAAPTQPAEPDSGSSGSSGREDAIVMRRSGLCSGKAVGRPHE